MNSGNRFSKYFAAAIVVLTLMICFSACGNGNKVPATDMTSQSEVAAQKADEQSTSETKTVSTEETQSETGTETEEEPAVKTMTLKIDDTTVSVDWEENESVAALTELVKNKPLTIQMSMYGGFEQVGSIGKSLPKNDVQITTQAGDIVLYSGSQIVVFYGSNSWAYTRLGHISDKSASQMKDLLANGNVTIEISME